MGKKEIYTAELNSIEKMKSKALIDSDISHDAFPLVVNEEQNNFRLKKASE